MPAPAPRRNYRTRRKRSGSSGTGLACVLAAVAIAGAMGMTVFKDKPARATPKSAAVVGAPVVAPVVVERRAPKPRVAAELERLAKAVKAAEKQMPEVRKAERGPGFEEVRIGLLSQISEARDELGRYLDRHPSDDKANRLWDRVLRLYVALKKL